MKKYLALIAGMAIMLASCTAVRIETADGSKYTYIDWHPAGNAVDVDATLEDIGKLKLSRNTEDASKIADAVVEALQPVE